MNLFAIFLLLALVIFLGAGAAGLLGFSSAALWLSMNSVGLLGLFIVSICALVVALLKGET